MTYFCALSRFAIYLVSKHSTIFCYNAEYGG
nr:MAG TPA: hypothetical protein [Caudoviricetes sp.]